MVERIRPNARIQGIGHHLAQNIAPRTTQAQHHLALELTICDGYAAKGETAGRSTSDNTTTEAAALARTHITNQLDEITNSIQHLNDAANRLQTAVTTALKSRAPDVVQIPRCRDNQIGREGAIIWGRTDCLELAVKAGLCMACYKRDWNWRKTQGLQPRDVEPAA